MRMHIVDISAMRVELSRRGNDSTPDMYDEACAIGPRESLSMADTADPRSDDPRRQRRLSAASSIITDASPSGVDALFTDEHISQSSTLAAYTQSIDHGFGHPQYTLQVHISTEDLRLAFLVASVPPAISFVSGCSWDSYFCILCYGATAAVVSVFRYDMWNELLTRLPPYV